MINMLIADDNIDFARNLMYYFRKVDYVKVIALTENGKEVINIIKEVENIDIIILDLKIPEMDGIEILKVLEDKYKERFEHSCIVISGENEYIQRLVKSEIVFDFIQKGTSMSDILEKINRLIDYKQNIKEEKNIENKIYNEIVYLGYDNSHIGTQYLINAISYIALERNCSYENLEKDIYPYLCKKYNSHILNIKKNIARATEVMYCNCSKERLMEYFSLEEEIKPKTKNIIQTILKKVQK